VFVRDRVSGADVYDGLLRYRGQLNYPSGGTLGSVDRNLARLATLLGRFDDARDHLEVADAMHARLRAPLFHALTLAARAEWLGAQDPSDPATPRLADEALGIARDLDARGVEREVRETIDRIGTRS
jgi:hypothetical protein